MPRLKEAATQASLSLLALAALICSCGTLARADEGHTHHAHAAEELGEVSFPTSCAPRVQKSFDRAVALLHSFWYEEAEKAFHAVATGDPACAIAYWGSAMSIYHPLWESPDAAGMKRGLAAIRKAKSLNPRTPRERQYIAALAAFYEKSGDHEQRARAYSRAMHAVYQQNPADTEAAVFYALSLLGSEPEDDAAFANRKQAAAILEKVFARNPTHPGVAHYLIHAYDRAQLAPLGLNAARRYAQIAPSSPHALHMPSHIFVRLGLWPEAIASNLASVAATRRTAAMHMGDVSHQLHAMDFLVYAYLQTGQEAAAKKIMDGLQTLHGVDRHEVSELDPEWRARYAIELRAWADAAKLPVAGKAPQKALTYWARVIGASRSGDPAAARDDFHMLQRLRRDHADARGHYGSDELETEMLEARAWLAFSEGRKEDAIKTMRQAAFVEDRTGPETLALPAREMLAGLLLELNRPQEALAEYEASLRSAPNRFNSLYGAARAARLAGKTQAANGYWSRLLANCAGANSGRPELAEARALLARR